MTPTEFLPITKLMSDVGQQIATWRTDKKLRHLYSEADFKTEADQRAQELIHQGIERIFPGTPILSEESPQSTLERPNTYWLIDPIDGTASWYHGFQGFVTQAAFIENNKPVFGIIYAPLLRNTWTAVSRKGAYLNDLLLPILSPSTRLIITDNTPQPYGIAKFFCEQLPATGYRESGSLGLKAALVADGTADLFIKDVIVRDWDFAPAAVILQEVGGHLGFADGFPYAFTGSLEKIGGVIVARDRELFDHAADLFSQYKKIADRA